MLIATGCIFDDGMNEVDCGDEILYLKVGDKTGLNVKTINQKLEYRLIDNEFGKPFASHKIVINGEYNNGEKMYVSFEIELDTNNNNIYFNILEGCAPLLIPKDVESQVDILYCKVPTYENYNSITRLVLYSVKKNDFINRESVTMYTNQQKLIIRDSIYTLKTINNVNST